MGIGWSWSQSLFSKGIQHPKHFYVTLVGNRKNMIFYKVSKLRRAWRWRKSGTDLNGFKIYFQNRKGRGDEENQEQTWMVLKYISKIGTNISQKITSGRSKAIWSIRKKLCWIIEKDSDCSFLDLFFYCFPYVETGFLAIKLGWDA